MNDYEVEWADGIKTRMNRLDQERTYAGLLEGIPTRDTNEWFHINRLVNPQAREKRLLLWAPQNKVQGWPEIFMGSPTAALPAITCIVEFGSLSPARDKTVSRSYLEVIWFQDEWALPIISEVLGKIKELNWRDVAIDYEP